MLKRKIVVNVVKETLHGETVLTEAFVITVAIVLIVARVHLHLKYQKLVVKNGKMQEY